MKSTTRYSSALVLWFISMTIFVMFSNKQHPQQDGSNAITRGTRSSKTRISSSHGASSSFLFANAFQITAKSNLPYASLTPSRLISSSLSRITSRLCPLYALSSTDLRQDFQDELINEQEELEDTNSSPITSNNIGATATSAAYHNNFLIHSIQNSFQNVNVLTNRSKRALQLRKRNWIEKSTSYYSTVMRNESRRARGQIKPSQNTLDYHRRNLVMAKKLYYARNKIKTGALNHAETIYRKLIDELIQEEEDDEECDHAQLAISTLLLALLLQRTNQITETRKVFNRFFTIIHRNNQAASAGSEEHAECACSAKVLQAYALFEMKQGHVRKSYRLAQMAVKLDSELKPLLKWKQFRDAKELSIMNGWTSSSSI